ncbi:MAG: hypothetical protein Kow0010_16330 [Dehalococcoidia bacterium]
MRRPNPKAAARTVGRLIVKLVTTATSVAVALWFVQAAAGQETPPAGCYRFDLDDLQASVAGADVIVIGTVEGVDGQTATLRPHAFLKGPVSAAAIVLGRREASDCPQAVLVPGERALVVLSGPAGARAWPGPSQLFTLADGWASNQDEPPAVAAEAELVERIRSVTGQYAVPAADEGEGASIGWVSTVLPVGLALVLLFGVGLVLMRIWHRIDPT